jgi:aminomethyltransferase
MLSYIADMDTSVNPFELGPVWMDGARVGAPTLALYSPRLERNIALALLDVAHSRTGTDCEVLTPFGPRPARVVPKPLHDPAKRLPTG